MRSFVLLLNLVVTFTAWGETLEEILSRKAKSLLERNHSKSAEAARRHSAPYERERAEEQRRLEEEYQEAVYRLNLKHYQEAVTGISGRNNFLPRAPIPPTKGIRYSPVPESSPASDDWNRTADLIRGEKAFNLYSIEREADGAPCVGTAVTHNALITARHCLGGYHVKLLPQRSSSFREVVHPDPTINAKDSDLAVVFFNEDEVDFKSAPHISKAQVGDEAYYGLLRDEKGIFTKTKILGFAKNGKLKWDTHYLVPRDLQNLHDSGSPLLSKEGHLIGVLSGCNAETCLYFALLSQTGLPVLDRAGLHVP